jgi:hypothetical protein
MIPQKPDHSADFGSDHQNAPFLKERRTRGLVRGPRTGNPGFSRDVGYHRA